MLKYSHAAVGPATGNTPPAKSRKKEDLLGCNPSEHGARHEAITPDGPKPPQVVRLRMKKEKLDTLFANAI